jgi:hypothetical protein
MQIINYPSASEQKHIVRSTIVYDIRIRRINSDCYLVLVLHAK